MMYWVRFAGVCASVFILLYAVLSLALAFAWGRLKHSRFLQGADALFVIRVLPAVTAVLVLAFVVAPSFWVLEPPAADEWIGLWAGVLSIACFTWLTLRSADLYSAWRSTSRIFQRALPREVLGANIPVFELADAGANLFVAGVLKP